MVGSTPSPPPPGRSGQLGKAILLIGPAVLFIGVLACLVLWFVVRVEVNKGEFLVLVRKTGKPIPADLMPEFTDQVVLYPELVKAIADKTGETEERVRDTYKGIRLEVFSEARYFFNPYTYKLIKGPATQIGQSEIGVLVRKFGKPLPFPKTVATEPDERGPTDKILTQGRHNVNLLAYEIQKFPMVLIPEGHVGVVTLLSGDDPADKNTYTVEPGEKGVQRRTFSPGLYPNNPYLKQIQLVDIRSQKYDMLGDDSIHFPSNDSFEIKMEGTIEWAVRPDRVAEVTVAYGDEDDILSKIILPNARSISRIQGSKLQGREFISGATRKAFQDHWLTTLKEECWKQGIEIKSALVRDIQPPPEMARLISQREQADQEIERFTNQMEEARAQARLVEQQEMQARNSAIGDARREVVSVTKEAEEHKGVAITEADRELAVAKLRLEAAEKQAAALRSRGEAEANVVLFDFQAEAEPLAAAVNAFGDGRTYAQMFFLEKIAPSIQSILSNTDGPFADIFKQYRQFDVPAQQGGEDR